MVWFITGRKRGLVLGTTDSGNPICHGQAAHDPRPPGMNDFGRNIDHALLKRIAGANCAWTLVLTTEAGIEIDPLGEGLFERACNSPESMHVAARFYANDPELVGFTFVVPEAAFKATQRLFELVLQSTSLSYAIAVHFRGFRVPHAEVDTPTWQEFIDGRPLFLERFSVSVSEVQSDA